MKGRTRRHRERLAKTDEQRPVAATGEWALIWRFYFKTGGPEDRIMYVGTEAECLRLDEFYRIEHGWPIYHGWPEGDERQRKTLPVHAATMTRTLADALEDGAYDVRRNPPSGDD